MSRFSLLVERRRRELFDRTDRRPSFTGTRETSTLRRIHVHVSIPGCYDVQIMWNNSY